MASGRIKGITIEIGGDTSKLGAALNSVDSKLRGLQGELNTVNRLLRLDPQNVTLLSNKYQILSDKINATKDKLNTLKEAQRQAAEQLERGEIGADQYRALTTEVERTQIELNQLEDEASQTAQALEAAGNESTEAAGDMQRLGDAAQEAGSDTEGMSVKAGAAMGAVSAAVQKAIQVIGDLINKLKDAALSSAEWADTFNTYAAQFHVSTESLQKFAYAADIVDVSIETFGSSLGKLTKNMQSAANGSKTQADAFAKLGVSVTDSNGNLRKAEDVMYDVIDALGEMENETEADATANAIFGRSFQDLNPLVAAGSDTLRELGDEAVKVGAVMSQDALDGTNKLQDSLDRLKSMTGVVQRAFSQGMAPALTRITDKINKSLASPKLQRTLKKIGEVIGTVAEAFVEFAGAVADNADIILSIVAAIGIAFLSWKIESIIAKVGSAIMNLANQFASKGASIIATIKSIDAASMSTIIGAIIAVGVAIAGIVTHFLGASEAAKEFNEDCGELYETANNIRTDFDATNATLATNADTMRSLAGEIETLDAKIKSGTLSGQQLANAQVELQQKTMQYNAAAGETILTINSETGAIEDFTGSLVDNTEELIKNQKAQALKSALEDTYKAQADALKAHAEFMAKVNAGTVQLTDAQKDLVDQLSTLEIGTREYNAVLLELFRATGAGVVEVGNLDAAMETLSNIYDGTTDILSQDNYELQTMTGGLISASLAANEAGLTQEYLTEQMQTGAEAAAEQTEAVKNLTDTEVMHLIRARENGEELSAIEQQQLEAFAASNEERYAQLEEINQKEQEYLARRLEIIQNGNEAIQLSYEVSLEQRTANMQHNAELVQNYESNISKIKQDAASNNNKTEAAAMNAYLSTLMDGSEESMAIVQQMVDAMEDTSSDGGHDIVYGLAKQYYSTLDAEQAKMFAESYETGEGISEQGGEGVASNNAMQDEAATQMRETARTVNDVLNQDRSFFFSGQGVIRKIANGMETMASQLYATADRIVQTLKSKFTFGVSVTQTGSGAQVRAFAKGGVVYGREIIQVAENEPEAIIPLSRMGDIVDGILRQTRGGQHTTATGTTYFQPQITINAQKLTDNELNRAVRFVSREFAKVTGGQM